MKKTRIGIVGGTRGMGKWFAEYLMEKGYAVEVLGKGGECEIPALAARSHVLVVAVPIAATIETIRNAGPHMAADGLLMDLTSLKAEPVKAMLEHSRSEVIGLHPLFGPGVPTLREENVFIWPARSGRWLPWLRSMLLHDGARLVETTPEKHDEMMGYVQVLTHLSTIAAGLVLRESGIGQEEFWRFSTPAFRAGLERRDKIFLTNPRLYGELIALNPKAGAVAEAFERNLSRVRGVIEGRGAEGLMELIQEA
jgi:prephenate dehydrogenase